MPSVHGLRILITGPDGQVGWECRRSLQALGRVHCAGRAQLDLCQPDGIRALVRELAPDVIVNAAAYTAVDRAESEPVLAHAVNAAAPAVLAEEAMRLGASLVHLSTDYVFDGTKAEPYIESDACNPVSVYGRTKLAGEQAILATGAPAIVLRTSWVYAMRGHNFLRTIARLAREREELRIVDDQWGAPTWARSIAEGIAAIVARAGTDRATIAQSFLERGGIFHLTAAGRTTWYRFAERLLDRIHDPDRRLRRLVPIPSVEYPTPARRPANSTLDGTRLAQTWGVALPEWDVALDLAVAECDVSHRFDMPC
jgi:dTDP-4-dehydrorhamnose reductase